MENLKEIITSLLKVIAIFIIIIGIAYMVAFAVRVETTTVIGEGEVEAMRIDAVIGSDSHIVTIGSKDFEVNEWDYYQIEVGYIVRIFRSGDVEILNSTISTKNDKTNCTNCS
jgi:hypothetical protein